MLSIPERFWSKVNKTDTCWLWIASTDHGGYGRFFVSGKKFDSAHRNKLIIKGDARGI